MFDQHREKLKLYTKAVAQGDINSLIVVGRGGIGKTYLVSEVMEELGLKEGVHYIYLNSYITPTELFIILERVNRLVAPKILILDDIEYSIKDRKTISILKAALWERKDGHRQINYQSGTYKINNTKIDNFEGKVIILLNELILSNPLVKALKDRGMYYDFIPSKDEMREAIMELAQNPYKNISQTDRIMIANYVLQTTPTEELSLRNLIKSFNLFLANSNFKKIFNL